MSLWDISIEAAMHAFCFLCGLSAGVTHDNLLPNPALNALFEGTAILGVAYCLDWAMDREIRYQKLRYLPALSAGAYVGHYLRQAVF